MLASFVVALIVLIAGFLVLAIVGCLLAPKSKSSTPVRGARPYSGRGYYDGGAQ